MKSLKRYYDINQSIYTRLIDEVRDYSHITKPRHGENVFDISGYGGLIGDLLNVIKRLEHIVFKIISHKIRSKKDYISLYRAIRKENIFSIQIPAHEFYLVNQFSPLFSLYEKCLQLLEEHNKKLEQNGINLSETVAFLYENEVVSLAYITFFDLIREHFKDDLKAAVSRYSEHYRSVIADLKAHHKTILAKHERVDALTLRLPISCCNNYDFTEIEIDNYLLAISKFLNNLRKNKTLKHIVGYVVGRSFIAEV